MRKSEFHLEVGLPKTSTIVAVTSPVFVKVWFAPPGSDTTSPGSISTASWPSTVNLTLQLQA